MRNIYHKANTKTNFINLLVVKNKCSMIKNKIIIIF